MLSEVIIQRRDHLKLQGFTIKQISEMQKVTVNEVFEVCKKDFVTSSKSLGIVPCDTSFNNRIKMNK